MAQEGADDAVNDDAEEDVGANGDGEGEERMDADQLGGVQLHLDNCQSKLC